MQGIPRASISTKSPVDNKEVRIATERDEFLFGSGSPSPRWAQPYLSPTGQDADMPFLHTRGLHSRSPFRRQHSSNPRRVSSIHPIVHLSIRQCHPSDRRLWVGGRCGAQPTEWFGHPTATSEALHQSRGLYGVSSTHPPVGPSKLTTRRWRAFKHNTFFLRYLVRAPPPYSGAPLVTHL